MPRACTICTHPGRHGIETAIVDGEPKRGIARRFSVTDDAIRRHARDHLSRVLAESGAAGPTMLPRNATAKRGGAAIGQYAAEHAQHERAHALDIIGRLAQEVQRVTLLSDAVDAWLRDPADPTRYSVDPRAEDVWVIYHEPTGELIEGVTTYGPRRKARLSELLGRIAGATLEVEATETKYADPRELLLKASESARGQMTLALTVLDKLYSAREVETFQAAVLDAIAEVAPDVRESILDNLRRRQPLRGDPRPAFR